MLLSNLRGIKYNFVKIVWRDVRLYKTCNIGIIFQNGNVSFGFKRFISTKGFRQPTVEKFRARDNIPESYDLIYRSSVSSYLYVTQIVSSVTIATMCVILLFSYNTKNDFQIHFKRLEQTNIVNTEKQMWFFAAGFLALYFSVMLLMVKCPVRIYFNEKTKQYLAVIHSIVPTKKNVVTYKIGDVIHTPKEGLFPWNEYKYKLRNGKILVMLDHSFRKPDDLNIMLGHAKL